MHRAAAAISLLFGSSLLACSNGDPSPAKGAPSTPDAAPAKKWERFIEGDWSLPPGGEQERGCFKKLITEDVYVSAIRPVHPLGTHHTLLTLGDGKTDCTSAVISGLVYAAAVGSPGLDLPPGVALKFPKGKYLNLGLHLYNTSQDSITGTSGMEIVRMDAKDVKYEAEATLAGTFDLKIPPGRQVASGECKVTADQSVFAIFPHMHQMGVHLKTTFTIGGKSTVVHDAPFSFSEQLQIPLDPVVTFHPGDSVGTECTYENGTANTATFGESSNSEMCFTVLFRYPKQDLGICAASSAMKTALPGPPCAKVGDVGNDVGISRYCTRGGGECAQTGGTFCLGDFTTGEFGNFCSTTCTSDAECGAGASCQGPSGRQGCIPTACVADGGTLSADGGSVGADAASGAGG